jgi:predicted secreted hydrolase
VVGDNGWDWFGLQLDDGSDLIVYRIKDNQTGRVLRAEATLLDAAGRQTVDRAPTFVGSGAWTDPATKITYPQVFTITLPSTGHRLVVRPAFPAQTIPVLGIGDAIWEGVVEVEGTAAGGRRVTGRGYRELVGYRRRTAPATPAAGAGWKPAPRPKAASGRGR